jgi:hypothetical protein
MPFYKVYKFNFNSRIGHATKKPCQYPPTVMKSDKALVKIRPFIKKGRAGPYINSGKTEYQGCP